MSKKHGKKKARVLKKRTPARNGVLDCSVQGQYGFVVCNDGKKDIFVRAKHFAGANHGDTVRAQVTRRRANGKPEGEILKIIKRRSEGLTAVITYDFGAFLSAKPDDRRFYPQIRIPAELSLGAKIGDRVAVELTGYAADGSPDGAAVSLLGNADSLKGMLNMVVLTSGIKADFDADTLAAAENISLNIKKSDLEGRLDLRGRCIFTIDGDDAKDFDDAVSIRKTASGYNLGVHIADVSHYVRPHTPLDTEALARGTSVYLPDRVIPMLPERLSNGICSLVPGEDRLTLSCIMSVGEDGEVKSFKITKSVIRSRRRMTYSDVQKILDRNKAFTREYRDILTPLTHMSRLCNILAAKRARRHSLDFDIPEARVTLKNDVIGEIRTVQKLKSHHIIEEFMLLANETVARFAREHKLPFVYRVHATPDADKVMSFNRFLLSLGLSITDDISHGVTQETFLRMLERVKDEPYEQIVKKSMLRAMMKAEYLPEPAGHFGLACADYCHFTSPIRRYPDLAVHRVLSAYLAGKSTARFANFCVQASRLGSECERRAEECERDAVSILKAAYISRFIGRRFDAVVSFLTGFGIYAELDNTIEGVIRFSTISDDHYNYIEELCAAVGEGSGRVFRIGDSVEIAVSSVNVQLGKIDFMLWDDYKNQDNKVEK